MNYKYSLLAVLLITASFSLASDALISAEQIEACKNNETCLKLSQLFRNCRTKEEAANLLLENSDINITEDEFNSAFAIAQAEKSAEIAE